MTVRRRLVRQYLVAVVGSLVVFTLAYDVGMSLFEGRPRTLLESFEIVMQTFTTTGYGQDAPWRSPVMTFLVVGMQIASLGLIFAAFPIVIVPLVEDALSRSPPTGIEREGHVLICGSAHGRGRCCRISRHGRSKASSSNPNASVRWTSGTRVTPLSTPTPSRSTRSETPPSNEPSRSSPTATTRWI